ncbi:MAG: DUF2061 domain-containing protein [Sulfitobacter sp.]
MEKQTRIIAKAITWQISGFMVMTVLGYVTTGSFQAATGLAVSACGIGLVSYVIHERIWAKVRWGRIDTPTRAQSSQVSVS